MKTNFLNPHYVKENFVLLLSLFVVDFLQAQIHIQFIPALNGQSVNGLFTAQVQNTTTTLYNGKLKITVRDANNKIVLLALTPSVAVRPGVTLIQALAPQTKIQFGNSPAANIIAQSGRFPENEYEYCFEFAGLENKGATDEQVFENCFSYYIQAIVPLSLVYPGDGDELCNTRPNFNWQPPMPVTSSYRYRIIVTEKKDRQVAADALLNNIPVFQQENIAGLMLLYPPQVPDLQKDKKYVWQVAAYEGNTKVIQSEIWEFSITCNEKKPDSSKESYRQLSGALNGNYYMSAGTLRFSVTNPYSVTDMAYSITDVSDPTRQISNLPAVKVQTGLNKIDIALEDINGIQINSTYLLKIKNIGDHMLYLQFIYKGDEAQ